MEKVRAWDLWILDHFYQPIADKVWQWVDISCFNLARGAVFVYGISWFTMIIVYDREAMLWASILLGVSTFIFLIWTYFQEYITGGKYMNPARVTMWVGRLTTVYFIGLSIIMWMIKFDVEHLLSIVTNTSMYVIYGFGSCQPRPPVVRWYKQLLPRSI